jgi:hypothetical protein
MIEAHILSQKEWEEITNSAIIRGTYNPNYIYISLIKMFDDNTLGDVVAFDPQKGSITERLDAGLDVSDEMARQIVYGLWQQDHADSHTFYCENIK